MSPRERLEALAASRRVPEEVNAVALVGLAVVDALAALDPRPDPVEEFLDALRLTETALRVRVAVRRNDGEWAATTLDGNSEARAASPREALRSLLAVASREAPP